MSNNSPKEVGIYKAKENAPDYVIKVLNVIEEIISQFTVTVKILENSTTITLRDKKSSSQEESFRLISLNMVTKPKSYRMNLYYQTKGSKDLEHIYEIKVDGDYELNTLKSNLEKLIKGKNLSHRPRFYPY